MQLNARVMSVFVSWTRETLQLLQLWPLQLPTQQLNTSRWKCDLVQLFPVGEQGLARIGPWQCTAPHCATTAVYSNSTAVSYPNNNSTQHDSPNYIDPVKQGRVRDIWIMTFTVRECFSMCHHSYPITPQPLCIQHKTCIYEYTWRIYIYTLQA